MSAIFSHCTPIALDKAVSPSSPFFGHNLWRPSQFQAGKFFSSILVSSPASSPAFRSTIACQTSSSSAASPPSSSVNGPRHCISLYHQIKTSISFLCRRKLNSDLLYKHQKLYRLTVATSIFFSRRVNNIKATNGMGRKFINLFCLTKKQFYQ